MLRLKIKKRSQYKSMRAARSRNAVAQRLLNYAC